MTIGFHQLEIGDTLELKGPLGSFIWEGSGTAVLKGVHRNVTHLGLICGGSGVFNPLNCSGKNSTANYIPHI